MSMIADIILAAGAFGAAFYCLVLSRRLSKFNNLQNGMGGAVATLSAQVDDLEKTLEAAKATAQASAAELDRLTQRGEDVRRQLELQMAALHDVSGVQSTPSTPQSVEEKVEADAPVSELVFSRKRNA